MEKKEGRRLALAWRNGISEADRKRWSLEIQKKVRRQPWYHKADIVLSYVSFRSEVSTEKINEWILKDGKQLYLPRTYADRHVMEFYRITDLSLLEEGYQGIPEPAETVSFLTLGEEAFLEGKNIIMIMPGVAFDSERNRIGYGGGYYDRYLSVCGDWISKTVMLAYHGQKLSDIESDGYDKRPDKIVINDSK